MGEPAFNPDQYLAEKTAQAAPAFDPDKYLAAKTAPVAAKPEGLDVAGLANSAMRGGAQGATFGFADEGAAGLAGLKDYVAGKLGLRGDVSLSDAYHTNRDAIRAADAQAAAEHPAVYLGGNIAGSLGTAFVPGLGALNVGKGAGLIEAGAKGAAAGGLAGAGGAKEITDVPGEAEKGALVGGLAGGALNVGGKVIRAVGDKLRPASIGAVLLNAPESALQRYIDNPAAVNAARPRADIIQQEFLPRLEGLQSDVVGGSKASRDVLASEGQKVPGSSLADILDAKRQKILDRSEGVLDDPRMIAAAKWLEETADKYRPTAGPDGQLVDRQLSTGRIKDLVQNLDQQTEFQVAPGQFAKVDDTVRKGVRSDVDQLLKGTSPAYTDQMKTVAADTALLGSVGDLGKSPQGFDNLLKRTQRGTAPHQLENLKAFDERTGGGLLDELQNSAAKDALAKGAMNGSRNVNFQGGIGDIVGEAIGGLPGKVVGRTLGMLGGATADKYGPAMAKGLVDAAASAQNLLQTSEGIQTLGKYAAPLMKAASEGNQALAATSAYLIATDPNFAKIVRDPNDAKRSAIQRRIGP